MHRLLSERLADRAAPPLVMGILNVTPDSFSDGNEFLDHAEALAHARRMIAEGADIIDVGPESTRPGAPPVAAGEQTARAIPVISAIREHHPEIAISIDTRLASVAEAALDAGADIVNDVSALRDDPGMANVVSSAGAAVILMHRRGTSVDMQRGGGPQYDDLVGEISGLLRERQRYAEDHGIDPMRIILDPGIGFGKRVEHNLTIMRNLDRFVALGQPLLVGASRKSFIGNVLDIEDPKRREAGSLACVALAVMAGAAIVRVHAVRETVEAVRLCRAIRMADTEKRR